MKKQLQITALLACVPALFLCSRGDKEERKNPTSPMPDFNDIMTIRQLTKVVTFLHDHDMKVAPDYDDVPMM